MAAFPIDAAAARGFLPGNELQPARLWRSGLLVGTVVNYESTDIGKYIEFSVAIACTHGPRPAPRLLPLLLRGPYGLGQYVYDLPVSTEISVKGGKGIWGMPKHQASLEFLVGDEVVSSRYDHDDGSLAVQIEIARPARERFPLRTSP
jgi:Acetoacetate decarboxylase (ADC)